MPGRFLFVGPTLPDAAELVSGSGIEVLPPVSAGDLLALPVGPGDVVGIVDGYFHRTRSIPHKEILDLLARGARVLGAASLGALRAAELHPYGMEGIGGIFADYRDGRLVADDEVTLMHGTAEDGYSHRSEPLVNLRASLDSAVAAGSYGRAEADRLIADLGAMPYRDRTRHALGTSVPLVDRKRADALELLEVLRKADPVPPPAPAFPETVHVYDWRIAAGGVDSRALALCQVLAPDYPDFHRGTVLAWLAARCRETCGAPGDAVDHGAHVGLFRADRPDPDLVDRWTTPAERAALDTRELLTRLVVRAFRIRPGIVATGLALRAFRASRARGPASALVGRVAAVNAAGRRHRPDFDPAAIAADQVLEWLAQRWCRPADELELAAFDRGFSSTGGAVAAARQVYLAARCEPEVAGFSLAGG
ncbi:hypothetical protein GCM10022243_57950 [Saccharothrix violaceirubra]|uniref:TfuA-like core domain-containing protein n=1 Tax=Saccharothrix violaceirubra TaxID=413306 RepID=A0A7W7T3A3_9PSEU|nr:TfuA domain-containing protein [Saccharothrix violaceirubra]MBB4965774.1 hypothetical protein [Saccharothrix violaceirubra]